MREIKLTIDGKEVQLTDEQLKALRLVVRKPLFDRVDDGGSYYFINCYGDIKEDSREDDMLFNNCNYFNDEAFANQVALHQLLYRKLLKFAYDNGYEDEQEWNKTNCHYYVSYNTDECRFYADVTGIFKHRDVWFCSRDSANRAIHEVVEPFVKEHPEFVW